MAQLRERTIADHRVELGGALAVAGLALAAVTLRSRGRSGAQTSHDKRQALATYLREHLSGADTAIQIVARLELAYDGLRDGVLFTSLHQQLLEDRAVVTALLMELGMSPLSIKRLAGRAAGNVIAWTTNPARGDLSLFRAIEALSIGVQGKRCLWRALQATDLPLRAPGRRTFADLETRALDQWEAIEHFRRSLVPDTFAA